MELFDFYCLDCLMMWCFCFPPFSQNVSGFKRSFINSTFYSSGTFLVSTARHARSRASPNTTQIHTKTRFCGNETFSHWICFLLLFIHNFILLITGWSLIQICKGGGRDRERERERGREINVVTLAGVHRRDTTADCKIRTKFTIVTGLVVIWKWNKIQTQKSLWLLKEKIFYALACFLYNLRNKDCPWQSAICHFTHRTRRPKSLLKVESKC